MPEKKEDKSHSLADFMYKKQEEKKAPIKRETKTEKNLREKREEREKKEKEELEEAKKTSVFKASRYRQDYAMKKRMKIFSILYPLAIMGAILAFIGILKLTPFVSKMINSVIKTLLIR